MLVGSQNVLVRMECLMQLRLKTGKIETSKNQLVILKDVAFIPLNAKSPVLVFLLDH